MAQPTIISPLGENWENEGGSLRPEVGADELGIVTHLTETYSVGGYRYTSLADAVAQGRRMQKLGARK